MPGSRAAAWAVHCYTATGVVLAFLAAIETCVPQPDPRLVFLWLFLAVAVDATDGPLARRVSVRTVLPEIDGRKIDDIVDYLTFTFIPLLLVARMGWVPQPAILFVAPAMIASLFGFANVGAKDEAGGFFLGFPSYWNAVAFYAGIVAAAVGPLANGVALLVLAGLTVTPVRFIYPNLAPHPWKSAMIAGAFLWGGLLLAMLPRYPAPPAWLVGASLVYPLFYTAVSLREHARR